MQISKTLYMFVFKWKQYPENFAFLVLRIFEVFANEVCKFSKKVDFERKFLYEDKDFGRSLNLH